MYKHGIEVTELATRYEDPLATRFGVQVVVGTAPVFKVDDPDSAVNRAVRVSSMDEAEKYLGYSDEWEKFSLCASMKASFGLTNVYPVIFINVLDPAKHKKTNDLKEYPVTDHQITLEPSYVLKGSVVIKKKDSPETVYETDKDYILKYDDQDRLKAVFLSSGTAYEETNVSVECDSLDPEAVTEEDIIGAYDEEAGKESGLEVIRTIYPLYGIVGALLLAPGWSTRANVAAALQEKCRSVNGVFRCECVLDLDTKKAKKYTECKALKDKDGYTGESAIVLWPAVRVDGKVMPYSAVYAAMASYITATNGDVPYLYPSNKLLNIEAAVLDDGKMTEVTQDQIQAAYLNGDGIVTVIHDSGLKSWGNNCACYPEVTDMKERWIACRRMFTYVANYFILNYLSELDEPMNKNKIDDIVNSFNIWGNSLVSRGMCAGLRAEYRAQDNTSNDLLNGKLKVRFFIAPFTPLEYIEAATEFDVKTLQASILGEEA